MHRSSISLSILLLALTSAPAAIAGSPVIDLSRSPHAKLRTLDLTDVRWTSGFWADRFEIVRKTTIPVIWEALQNGENGAQYTSFLKAAGQYSGPIDVKRLNWWSDGDVYKTLESMAFVYALTKDPALDRRMDEMIAVFAKTQEPDGYLSTPIAIKGAKRWQNLSHHELYNMGHMMTAAVIHHRVTGKKSFLNVATRLADYLDTVFTPRPKELAHFGFNPSNIMGAAELYRATGNRKYLALAGTFVDMRGSAPGGNDQNQQRVRLRKETEAVGHAVTANYLYAGAADVYTETGDKTLLDALNRIWNDVTTKKMYVTGAVGGIHNGASPRRDHVHEAYNLSYELPNRLGYNETCANISLAMWAWRMLAITGDARYADTMELVLYNSGISGLGIEGKDFYYNNPLRRHGDELPVVLRPQDPPLRSPVLPCYCCPTNLSRTIASLNGWAYAKTADALWVNIYGSNRLETPIAGGRLKLRQDTAYPWEGTVAFAIEEAPAGEFALQLRVPAWAEGASAAVNGEAARTLSPGAYAELRRTWKRGDKVTLRLPMEPRLVVASPYLDTARNQVAVARGPLVYCLESPDLPAGTRVSEVVLPVNAKLTPKTEKQLLGGVVVIDTQARVVPAGAPATVLYSTLRPSAPRTATIRLIPYYAWANRGMSHMTVWLPVSY